MSYESARKAGIVNESTPARIGEIEIQARLYNGEFGTRWLTLHGDPVEVVHFGDWNREAGPDFKNATLGFKDGSLKLVLLLSRILNFVATLYPVPILLKHILLIDKRIQILNELAKCSPVVAVVTTNKEATLLLIEIEPCL
jgi:hypothetical protein